YTAYPAARSSSVIVVHQRSASPMMRTTYSVLAVGLAEFWLVGFSLEVLSLMAFSFMMWPAVGTRSALRVRRTRWRCDADRPRRRSRRGRSRRPARPTP